MPKPSEICMACESSNLSEVTDDSFGFGTVRRGTKHWSCGDCGSEYVTGSQMNWNAKCEVVEIEGPYKPIEIGSVFSANAYFDWSWQGKGFGQLSFSRDKETGKLTCMSECMSRDSVRTLLRAFADHIADNVELDDE